MTLGFSKIHTHPSPTHLFLHKYHSVTVVPIKLTPCSEMYIHPSLVHPFCQKYRSYIVVSTNLTPLKPYHNCHFPAFISPPSIVPSQMMVRGSNVFSSYLMHVTIFNYSEGA